MSKKNVKVHSERCVVSEETIQNGRGPEKRIVVQFSLTRGQAAALVYALANHDTAQSRDLMAFLENASGHKGILEEFLAIANCDARERF
jgi:hypothetical protein